MKYFFSTYGAEVALGNDTKIKSEAKSAINLIYSFIGILIYEE